MHVNDCLIPIFVIQRINITKIALLSCATIWISVPCAHTNACQWITHHCNTDIITTIFVCLTYICIPSFGMGKWIIPNFEFSFSRSKDFALVSERWSIWGRSSEALVIAIIYAWRALTDDHFLLLSINCRSFRIAPRLITITHSRHRFLITCVRNISYSLRIKAHRKYGWLAWNANMMCALCNLYYWQEFMIGLICKYLRAWKGFWPPYVCDLRSHMLRVHKVIYVLTFSKNVIDRFITSCTIFS